MKLSFDPEKTLAILLGIDSYENFNDVPPIKNNLIDFKNLLLDEKILGIKKEDNVRLIHNIDNNKSLRALKDIINDEELIDFDTIIVYYTGHGYRKSGRKELFLASQNSDTDISTSFIHFTDLKDSIATSHFQNRILILDSCHSGLAAMDIDGVSMTEEEMTISDEDSPNKGFYVITSCSGNDLSFFHSDEQNTYFTGEFLKLMNNGIANNKPYLDLDTIYNRLKSRLKFKQLPQPKRKSTFTKTEFYFCRNKKYNRKIIPNEPDNDTLSIEESNWNTALLENTRLAFKSFLRKHPDGKFKAEAERHLKHFSSKIKTVQNEVLKEKIEALLSLIKAEEKQIKKELNNTVGVYIGSSISKLCVFEGNFFKFDGFLEIIRTSEGVKETPNTIARVDNGQLKFGKPAERQKVTNPQNTIESILNYLYTSNNDFKNPDSKLNYYLRDGELFFNLEGDSYSMSELFSKYLDFLLSNASDYLGQDISNITIGTSYKTDNSLFRLIHKSANSINIKVNDIIDETSASFYSNRDETIQKGSTTLYISFDKKSVTISLFEYYKGSSETTRNLRNEEIGLEKLDELLIDFLVQKFNDKRQGINIDDIDFYELISEEVDDKEESIYQKSVPEYLDFKNDPMAIQRLIESAEKARIELTEKYRTEVFIPYITSDKEGPVHLTTTISEEEYFSLISSSIDLIKQNCIDILADENLSLNQVDKVILGGFTPQIPGFKKEFSKIYHNKILEDKNPFEMATMGVTMYTSIYFMKAYGNKVLILLEAFLKDNLNEIDQDLQFNLRKHINNLTSTIESNPWTISDSIIRIGNYLSALRLSS